MAEEQGFSSVQLAVKYGLSGATIDDVVEKKRAGWSEENIRKHLASLGLLDSQAEELSSLIVAKVDREMLDKYAPHLLDKD
jgi:hypothetical protein